MDNIANALGYAPSPMSPLFIGPRTEVVAMAYAVEQRDTCARLYADAVLTGQDLFAPIYLAGYSQHSDDLAILRRGMWAEW